VVEAGAPAFAAIGVESELRDDQQGAAGLADIEIHLSGLVREDAQSEEFVDEIVRAGGGIGPGDAEKDKQSSANGSDRIVTHNYTSLAYTLDEDSHATL
jgi:hypothetical protein